MTVTLDITGMYFNIEVPFVPNETIRGLMLRVQTITGAPGYDPAKPIVEFFEEPFSAGQFTLDGVTVIHRLGSAKSRQNVRDAAGTIIGQRQYQGGIYHFSDDSVSVNPSRPLEGLRAADPNKAFISSWQYYVYNQDGTEIVRRRPGTMPSPDREIVPYSRNNPADIIQDGQTIVWRLITIFTRASHGSRADVNISTRDSTRLA